MTAQDGGRDADKRSSQKLETLFRTLTSQRRRYIFYELQENEVSDLDTLATAVVAMEQDVPRHKVNDDDRANVSANLVHTDIPLLEDAGFVEYDARSETIRYSDPSPLLDPILRLCSNIDTEYK